MPICPIRISPKINTRPNPSFRSDTSTSAHLRNNMVLGSDKFLQNFAHKTSTNLGLGSGVEQRITLKQILEKQDVKVETELSRLTLGSRDGFQKLINKRRILYSGMCCCVMWCFSTFRANILTQYSRSKINLSK
jgi:hypothetical protein